ncbi:MAG TPA: 3-phosphoshikimate 1-carboxyvinyltransferase [Verrucomicrobiae bacterium]|nr:3-phosphoshikimate 1-carboxyvinyltransferase [Verrucomicrobiae bacterium]
MIPELIEIVPLSQPITAAITVPGSKSLTNRALVLAALAEGETVLEGALWSEDTQVMVECLQDLGFMVNVSNDPREPCNRSLTVYGLSGNVPRGGTAAQPLELFVGNAGTAARFLAALVCLGQGVYRLHGVPRMHDRPQAALFQALRQLGYRIDAPQDRLPALIHGQGPKAGRCQVSIEQSSQFASALILCAKVGAWTVEITGENAEESPYAAMTQHLRGVFPARGGRFPIEPDASSGSYFWAAGFLQTPAPGPSSIIVRDWPSSGWQIDSRFPTFWPLPATVSRADQLGDSIMTAIVLAPFATRATRFTELGRLRVQECERVQALRTELTKCGATVVEQGDDLTIQPSTLHGAQIDTYNDHRLAMCFAILGLKIPGIKIKNPACAKKTFPNFFQKLAAPPPTGLGATILDAAGQRLSHAELFAG